MPFILLPGMVPPAVSAEMLMLLGAPTYSIWTLLGAEALNATPFRTHHGLRTILRIS